MKLTDRQKDFIERVLLSAPLRTADREEDRVRQTCRAAGYVEHTGSPKKWRVTLAGVAALEGNR